MRYIVRMHRQALHVPDETLLRIGAHLTRRGWMLATAESCTGGLVGHVITELPGCSAWYAGGVIAYANHIKQDVLGVSAEILDRDGAVSRACVQAMAAGVRRITRAQAGVAVSGIAGPGGGSAHKPVGSVWMAWSVGETERQALYVFPGPRERVKRAGVTACLTCLQRMLDESVA